MIAMGCKQHALESLETERRRFVCVQAGFSRTEAPDLGIKSQATVLPHAPAE